MARPRSASARVNGPAAFTVTTAAALAREPATWGLMIAGFGLIGAAARLARQAAVTFA